MTHGDALYMTVESTQQSLQQRLDDALAPHRDPARTRDGYSSTDAFLAATSRHLAAVEAVLLPTLHRAMPDSDALCREYLQAARRLERTLSLVKARLYGEAHAIHLSWSELWVVAREQLAQHNGVEQKLVVALIEHDEPTHLDGLARRVFDAETRGPTRPHPYLPHTGMLSLVARRLWAMADRFWDAAEGRVIPEPIHPVRHRHDSLMSQYLVGDPHFDSTARFMEHRRHPRKTSRRDA
ncbi:MAG: hypothetical protein ACJ72A_23615 [Nocardioidaceae bacterium]